LRTLADQPILGSMETVIVRARSRNPRWDGPLRLWLESRADRLRKADSVQAVVVKEGRDDRRGVVWEIGLRLVGPGGRVVIRDLIIDLELLMAEPELCTGADVSEMRRIR
jgi:hypothetical protein